jgi:hypothetical protein
MSALKKFEIHYFLPDNMHSMDAVVKNKCEAEFLAIAYEVIRLLELDITLNTEALKEGGLRDIWECSRSDFQKDSISTPENIKQSQTYFVSAVRQTHWCNLHAWQFPVLSFRQNAGLARQYPEPDF